MQAQLVAQDIIANKLKTALGEKERKIGKDTTKVFKDGMAKLYTSDEVVEHLQEQKLAREEAEQLKERRAKVRKQKKEAFPFGLARQVPHQFASEPIQVQSARLTRISSL